MTEQGEAGLVCDAGLGSPAAGVMFDAETRALCVELADHSSFEMNIPVEDQMAENLLCASAIQIGTIENGEIQDNQQVPLMLVNDPEGLSTRGRPVRPSRSVLVFESFLKRCVAAQPVHRDDLGDEKTLEGVMGGINTAVLKFAPNLARQRVMEVSPHLAPKGPAAPGLGLGRGGGVTPTRSQKPQKRGEDSEGQ